MNTMTTWKLETHSRVAISPLRRTGTANDPPGLVSFRLIFDNGTELTLSLTDVGLMVTAFTDALSGPVSDDLIPFRCVGDGAGGFVLESNKVTKIPLSRKEVEWLCSELKTLEP